MYYWIVILVVVVVVEDVNNSSVGMKSANMLFRFAVRDDSFIPLHEVLVENNFDSFLRKKHCETIIIS